MLLSVFWRLSLYQACWMKHFYLCWSRSKKMMSHKKKSSIFVNNSSHHTNVLIQFQSCKNPELLLCNLWNWPTSWSGIRVFLSCWILLFTSFKLDIKSRHCFSGNADYSSDIAEIPCNYHLRTFSYVRKEITISSRN